MSHSAHVIVFQEDKSRNVNIWWLQRSCTSTSTLYTNTNTGNLYSSCTQVQECTRMSI